jgi:MFS family permease
VGLFGTVWAYLKPHEVARPVQAKLDWWGNITFAGGLVMLLIGITYAIMPYGGHSMGWTSPVVEALIVAGLALLGAFVWVERRVEDPMFRLDLFRIRAFTAGNTAGLLAAIGRGGLQFMLIIWLQGIWLPLHGYDFVDTPLWAGIYMVPLTLGFMMAGPASGWLSDRYGARPFATGGMAVAALMFVLLMLLPANFSYVVFAILLLFMGVGMGLFSAPNTTGIMNSVPASARGVASGMRTTFQNVGMVLSIGMFFSLMIVGLASTLPHTMQTALTSHAVPADVASRVANLPPVGSLFAAFLGYNPMENLLGPKVLGSLPQAQAHAITGKTFFPNLIAGPFMHGLLIVFGFGAAMCVIAGIASWLRGSKFIHEEGGEAALGAQIDAPAPPSRRRAEAGV